METSVTITLIICGALVILSGMNFAKWLIKRKDGKTLGNALGNAIKKTFADDDD